MSTKLIPASTHFDSKNKIWEGPHRDVVSGSESSLGRFILESLYREPDHIAQICDNNAQRYTNKDIALLSIRIAQNLEEMGLQQEDVIGVCATNTDFIAPLVFGALLCGVTVSGLDPSFVKDDIRHVSSITRPKLMFCDGKVYDKVQAALLEININIPIYTLNDQVEGARQIQELIAATGRENMFKVKPLKSGLKQTAVILCSSGTTGLPKGVCVSHETLLNGNMFNLSSDDKLLCFSTLYWASGILCLIQGTLCGCTRVITNQTYSPELFLRMIEQYKVTMVFTPPSQMALAIQSPEIRCKNLSSLKLYFCTGGALPSGVLQAFLKHVEHCEVIVGYGMSELGGACSFGLPTKPGRNGHLIPNHKVKIVDESDQNLGMFERGEICIKSPFKWAGYYQNPVATDAIYDQNGWIHSGDIGYFDEEGSLYVVDRKKDILKWNGFQFFPTEIEEIIMEIPDVVEVCVCGIADIISSFLPAAAVVRVKNSKLTEADVITYVAERMTHFKHLRGGVYFLDLLPKTPSGKTIRTKVTSIVESFQRNKSESSVQGFSDVLVSA